jgi:hypothetical protein
MFLRDSVQFGGRYAGLHMLAEDFKCFCYQRTSLPQQFNLVT